MNPLLFLIPAVFIIGGVFYMIYMNKTHKSAKAEIDINTERNKYTIYKQELLNQDFSQLKQWMKGKPIDAFTAASVPQSTASKVLEFVSDGVKKVALSAIWVRLRKIETDCFWVLSGNDMHFLKTNTDGDLDEHIIFDNFRIEEANLQYGGVLKSQVAVYTKSSEEYLPKTHIITFHIDDTLLSLEIHDRLNYVPTEADLLNAKKMLATRIKYQVVGEKFTSILQEKFPNLKIT